MDNPQPPAMPARRLGVCPWCADPIRPPERIALEVTHGFVHERCYPAAADLVATWTDTCNLPTSKGSACRLKVPAPGLGCRHHRKQLADAP